jgi:hypothetical protein
MDENSSPEFDDESGNDEFDENDDIDDDDDEIDTIATEKTTFHGMRIRNSIGTNLTNSYFRVIINNTEKYIHKQTACWMLTEKKKAVYLVTDCHE